MDKKNTAQTLKQCKIMLIEDDSMQILMYETAFKLFGFKFVSFNRGVGAVEMVVKEKPDFILLDLLLGDEYGMNILAKIKETSVGKKIPIVIFSNYIKYGLPEEAKRLGAVDFWEKSVYVPREIIKKIEDYLASKR